MLTTRQISTRLTSRSAVFSAFPASGLHATLCHSRTIRISARNSIISRDKGLSTRSVAHCIRRFSRQSQAMAPKILLHGAGAIGTVYVYLLHKAGFDVTAVCRSNYLAAKKDGFVIDSEKYGKGIRFQPKVVQSPTEAAKDGPFDVVIVSTKTLSDAETSRVIEPVVTIGRTLIALIQNGIGIEDELAQRYPDNPLLSCVVYLPATQIKPGHIQMGGVEILEVGSFPASAYQAKPPVKEAADHFMEILRKAGSDVRWYDDVQEKRWNKLLLNAPWNPICALTLSREVAFLVSSPVADKIIFDVMLEVIAISQALGYRSITIQDAEKQLAWVRAKVGSKGIEPSMLVDVLNGRRMEVETILGNPVRVAKSLGVDVPGMEMLYGLTKALDEAITFKQPGQSLGGDETRAVKLKENESMPHATL